ncbi:hypothetical protein LAG90_09010 [Marinilongibacter aquaticus]|uniref:hypothetical protein n=1 Tax=Marinilongibacter aquaticus TaxID=2975157 RepID=UPI0021BDC864|nr:hypothetical protein [Marinilongibacter aquaticus]UBM60773.1 hypothetical protein LAG90_09010 [Marinilongibacter aquaticus]
MVIDEKLKKAKELIDNNELDTPLIAERRNSDGVEVGSVMDVTVDQISKAGNIVSLRLRVHD